MQNGCAVKIVVSQNARDDLGQIWRFGAGRWSPEQADTYANTLFAAIFNLVDNPQTAKIHKRLGPGYRRLVIGEYGAATALECYILFAKRFPVLVDQVARKPNGMFKSLTL